MNAINLAECRQTLNQLGYEQWTMEIIPVDDERISLHNEAGEYAMLLAYQPKEEHWLALIPLDNIENHAEIGNRAAPTLRAALEWLRRNPELHLPIAEYAGPPARNKK